jgi:hypothetical protein
MSRNKHPNKEIEAMIQLAENNGWRYKKAGNSAHAWGRLLCPQQSSEGCAMSIWSTPRDVYRHAEQVKKNIARCSHEKEVEI